MFVCSKVIKDVAADATMNMAANHAIITTDIAMVVENIVHENKNKTFESDVITDMAEDAVDNEVGQSGVENDDKHAAGDEIIAIADENVIEHVSHTTTYR